MSSLSTACMRTLATVALLAAAAAPSHAATAGAPAKALGAFDGGALVQVQDRRGGPAVRGGGPAVRGGPAVGGGPRFSGPRFQGGPRFSGSRFQDGPRFSGRQFRSGQFTWRGQKFHNGRLAGRFHNGKFHGKFHRGRFHGGFHDSFAYWPYFAGASFLYGYNSYCERVLEPRLTRSGIVMRWVRRCPGDDDYYPYW